jgi:gliding motility-associated-like protein
LFEGVYNVTAVDETGCTADSTFEVLADIITDMEVTVFSSPVTCWNEGDGTATAAVTGGTLPISYQWNDPQAQITATAVGLVEEVYTVVVTDAIGCTLSYLVEVEPTVGCFFIADMLTPNGDGANDEWVIGGLEFFPSSSVQIFNRWGQLLFESKGYPNRWDGTYNGNILPIADYYYVITYDNSKDPITGTVTIKY